MTGQGAPSKNQTVSFQLLPTPDYQPPLCQSQNIHGGTNLRMHSWLSSRFSRQGDQLQLHQPETRTPAWGKSSPCNAELEERPGAKPLCSQL